MEGSSPAPTPKPIPLPSGEELGGAAALSITQAILARVIVMAGPVGSGKTSLLSAIYELFGKARMSAYRFAGSETIPAFERRCHPTRIASERALPETERTKLDGALKLLHLRVQRVEDGEPAELLMSDPSGEAFLLARDSSEECRKLSILRRADVLVLCLDGERIAKIGTRAATIADARTLLRSMLDAEMLGRSSHVQVLFTKCDQLKNPENETEGSIVARVEENFRESFEARLHHIEFFKTSVVPLDSATGVHEVFRGWVEREDLTPQEAIPSSRTGTRFYDSFMERDYAS